MFFLLNWLQKAGKSAKLTLLKFVVICDVHRDCAAFYGKLNQLIGLLLYMKVK